MMEETFRRHVTQIGAFTFAAYPFCGNACSAEKRSPPTNLAAAKMLLHTGYLKILPGWLKMAEIVISSC